MTLTLLLPPLDVWHPSPVTAFTTRAGTGKTITIQIEPTSEGSMYSVRFTSEAPKHRWTHHTCPDGLFPDLDDAIALIRQYYPQAAEAP